MTMDATFLFSDAAAGDSLSTASYEWRFDRIGEDGTTAYFDKYDMNGTLIEDDHAIKMSDICASASRDKEPYTKAAEIFGCAPTTDQVFKRLLE